MQVSQLPAPAAPQVLRVSIAAARPEAELLQPVAGAVGVALVAELTGASRCQTCSELLKLDQ